MKRTLLALTAALLAGVLLFAIPRGTAARSGSDDRAMAAASDMRAGQKLGRQPFGLTPSGFEERLLFALQAGSGVGLFCYAYLGLRRRGSAG
jgi:ABC-type cobalt transport system substrate-binding protein